MNRLIASLPLTLGRNAHTARLPYSSTPLPTPRRPTSARITKPELLKYCESVSKIDSNYSTRNRASKRALEIFAPPRFTRDSSFVTFLLSFVFVYREDGTASMMYTKSISRYKGGNNRNEYISERDRLFSKRRRCQMTINRNYFLETFAPTVEIFSPRDNVHRYSMRREDDEDEGLIDAAVARSSIIPGISSISFLFPPSKESD